MICCTACSHSFFVEPHLIFEPSFHSFWPQKSGPWTWHVFLISAFSPDPGQIQVIFVVEKLPLDRLFGWALAQVVAKRQRANMVSVKIFSIVYEVSVGWLLDWFSWLVSSQVPLFLQVRQLVLPLRGNNEARHHPSLIDFTVCEATFTPQPVIDIVMKLYRHHPSFWVTLLFVKQCLSHSLVLTLIGNSSDSRSTRKIHLEIKFT